MLTRDKYLRFILEWPDRYMRGGKTFKELFKLNGDISFWWLSEAQKKDPESSAVFLKLTRGETEQKAPLLLHYVVSRLAYLLCILTKVLVFKYLVKRRPAASGDEILFISIFGNTLKNNGDQLQDRYYLDLPDILEQKTGKKAGYLSFYYGSLWSLLKTRKGLPERVVFYENYLKVRDIIKALDIVNVVKYVVLERKTAYRESFCRDGRDRFALFLQEMRTSYVGSGIPEWALLSAAAERIAKERPVKSVVSFLEMYPYSRALYYGLKKGDHKIKTVAYQHATITPNKLWYVFSPEEMGQMPVPDHFIFQGEMGRDILIKGGYPEERCILTGSPRFDALYNIEKKPIKTEIPAGLKIVLVPTSYAADDAAKVIELMSQVAQDRKDAYFIFKSHPNFPIDELLKERGISNYTISSDNIQQLILRADVLVTTYSMTADEAIALNCPVISIENEEVIDLSTFVEIKAALRARTAAEIYQALDIVFYSPAELAPYKSEWPKLVRASFYKIDGGAKARVLDALAGIINQ